MDNKDHSVGDSSNGHGDPQSDGSPSLQLIPKQPHLPPQTKLQCEKSSKFYNTSDPLLWESVPFSVSFDPLSRLDVAQFITSWIHLPPEIKLAVASFLALDDIVILTRASRTLRQVGLELLLPYMNRISVQVHSFTRQCLQRALIRRLVSIDPVDLAIRHIQISFVNFPIPPKRVPHLLEGPEIKGISKTGAARRLAIRTATKSLGLSMTGAPNPDAGTLRLLVEAMKRVFSHHFSLLNLKLHIHRRSTDDPILEWQRLFWKSMFELLADELQSLDELDLNIGSTDMVAFRKTLVNKHSLRRLHIAAGLNTVYSLLASYSLLGQSVVKKGFSACRNDMAIQPRKLQQLELVLYRSANIRTVLLPRIIYFSDGYLANVRHLLWH
ncbi:hypothetical protein BSLG_004423 [Batrachochytrium salamandrivorans]|nr:hypothetical protein BSLG_004423 [Batrachochytrium salamandrivorans]